MKTFYFSINATYDYCEKLYFTGNNAVIVKAESGENVQIPSLNLRPFVTRSGLNGRFRLIINEQNKVESFEKIN
ncbi:MAG: hypothetical protein Alis3KO_37590 [Aliiglaciecola sp.]|uniref:DUF2835 family protein n=1 Tax=Aliiglaciecola sp. M165 TaxID=2593649 RepID=UPI00117BE850|nr:DUF2835 family protein [Aliiglaciecola sp. M165]TRY30076.1 DUF2835 family protein [Aliiglaciecola sp. M165]